MGGTATNKKALRKMSTMKDIATAIELGEMTPQEADTLIATATTSEACTDSKLRAGARIGFAPIGGSFDIVIDTEHGQFTLGNTCAGSRELADIRDEVNALLAEAEARFTPEAGWALMAREARMGARKWAQLSELF